VVLREPAFDGASHETLLHKWRSRSQMHYELRLNNGEKTFVEHAVYLVHIIMLL